MSSTPLSLQSLPVIEPVAAPFWQALSQRRLVVQWCNSCQRPIHYPRIHCPHCLGMRLAWRECTGNAVLHAFTIVYRHGDPYFKERVPFVAGLVSLEEGVNLMSNIVGIEPGSSDLRVGMPLRVDFRRIDDRITLHEFRPATPATAQHPA